MLCLKVYIYIYFCLQISSCLMVFFLSNMIETQCLSTGAFEITLNGKFTLCKIINKDLFNLHVLGACSVKILLISL